ncbi:MAG: hypothetical protein GY849_16070, partial [Deltaproteobacteria bacterium]|nr:hypothetical protein [Deltaproteobacteria bacterium]
IRFLPQDLANQADLSLDALRRSFAQMGARREITYMPPFRGRGVQVLERVSSEALPIDFQALQVRKAHELSKLDRIMAYASSEGCRRRFLLGYFGEELEGATCGACDLCQEAEDHGPGLSEDRADPVVTRKILSGIARLKGRFGLSMAVKVLTGSKDAMLFQFRLHRLSTYGLMSEYTQGQIRSWIKELMHKGCVVSRRAVMGEKSYPILELSDRGRRVMAGRETLRLSLPLSDRWAPAADMPLGQGEPAVFSRLRQLRAGLAREEGLPPYCIFQDRTLREMAGKLPKTPDE